MPVQQKESFPLQITEIVLPGKVEPSQLQIKHRFIPAPGPHEVLVEIEASGVSFAEQAMRRGKYPGQPKFPFVPGYDFVGVVRAVGPSVKESMIGTRVAAVTKTGGWASHAIIEASNLASVPPNIEPALAETVLVNGVTAWQMLHRKAGVSAGQTILVHGATGGVGTILCQLALHSGIRVIGTAAPKHHDALRASGVEPLDYNAPDIEAQVRRIMPNGVDAVFDHMGLESARISFGLLAKGGSLICYGNGTALDRSDSMIRLFFRLIAQITWWNLISSSRYVTFYNFWSGNLFSPKAFRRRLREDMSVLFDLLVKGAIRPVIAGRFALHDIGAAMELAESHTVQGKVIVVM